MSLDISSQKDSKYVVKTSKPKLLTLEVSVREKIDRYLFEHPEVSWDTFIESALIQSFKSRTQCDRTTKIAAERLTDRKRSAVYKRTQTMAKRFS